MIVSRGPGRPKKEVKFTEREIQARYRAKRRALKASYPHDLHAAAGDTYGMLESKLVAMNSLVIGLWKALDEATAVVDNLNATIEEDPLTAKEKFLKDQMELLQEKLRLANEVIAHQAVKLGE
jgi:hypothetical protein